MWRKFRSVPSGIVRELRQVQWSICRLDNLFGVRIYRAQGIDRSNASVGVFAYRPQMINWPHSSRRAAPNENAPSASSDLSERGAGECLSTGHRMAPGRLRCSLAGHRRASRPTSACLVRTVDEEVTAVDVVIRPGVHRRYLAPRRRSKLLAPGQGCTSP